MGLYGTKDYQLIIEVMDGVENLTIRRGTTAIRKKAEGKGVVCHVMTIRPAEYSSDEEQETDPPSGDFKLTKHSRIYLGGHGDWQNQTIGGRTPEYIARVLKKWSLPEGILISVIGCQLARDRASEQYGMLAQSVDSFSSQLHRLLKEKNGVRTVLFARVQFTGVDAREKVGSKSVNLSGEVNPDRTFLGTYRAEKSKVLFWWEGEMQVRGWMNYKTNGIDRIVPLDSIE